MSDWRAGAATIDFPVAIGTTMAGYVARTGPSLGTHDQLTVNALILVNGPLNLVIVAADLAAVDSELVDEIAAAAGLERSELIVCASHTHSGPAGVIARMHPADVDRLNPEMRAGFTARCVAAISSARGQIEPAELLFGQTVTNGLAANRNDADGPFDNRASVLATKTGDGRLSAILVHFACHPTMLSFQNRLVSADFPGVLRRELSRNNDRPVVLFANGAAGDVSTRFTRSAQDFAEVDRVGTELATAAMSALAIAQPIAGSIANATTRVSLPTRSFADAKSETVSYALPSERSAFELRKAETRAQGEAMLARLAQADPSAIRNEFDLVAWKVGSVNLVAVPGELFASLGARIQAALSTPTLVLGYANGYVGYLVDDLASAAGTYEALASPFEPGAGPLVADAARNLLRKLDDRD